MTLTQAIYLILNPLFILAVSPFFLGLTMKVKALAQGRKGLPLWQPYYHLAKLLRKEIVYSTHSSFIMRLAPYLNIGFLLAAATMVPVLFLPPAETVGGNIILFLYLIVSARFFMALAGLDAGSVFGGMGSSREMSLSAIIEPVTIITCAALTFVLKTTDIPTMFATVLGGSLLEYPALILVAMSLFITLIVETSRVPVDNPETHLELAMIHEAMVLEQSGPKLALMELSYGVKQTILMALLINTVFPWGLADHISAIGLVIGALSFILKAAALSVVIAIFESGMAKIRLFRLPNFFAIALFFAFITILFELLL